MRILLSRKTLKMLLDGATVGKLLTLTDDEGNETYLGLELKMKKD